MYFNFCLFLLYRNLIFFLFSPGKEESEKLWCVFHIATKTDVLFFFFEYLLCVFSSAQFGASIRFTTDLKNSLSVPVRRPLSLFFIFMPPWRHTGHLVNGKKKTRTGRRGKKKTCFSHETPLFPLVVSLRGVCATFSGGGGGDVGRLYRWKSALGGFRQSPFSLLISMPISLSGFCLSCLL